MATHAEVSAIIKQELDHTITLAWVSAGSYPCEAEWCAAEGTERTQSSERYCKAHAAALDHGPGCDGPLNCTCDPRAWLQLRAESYARDARAFKDMGDDVWAAAYRGIADELRKCASAVGS